MIELQPTINSLEDEINCNAHFQKRDIMSLQEDIETKNNKILTTLVTNIKERAKRDADQIAYLCDLILVKLSSEE